MSKEVKVIHLCIWLCLVTLLIGRALGAITGNDLNIVMIFSISLMFIGMLVMVIPIFCYMFIDYLFGLNWGDKWVDLVLRGIFDRTLWRTIDRNNISPKCPQCETDLEEDLEDSSQLNCSKCNYGWRNI